MNFERIVDDRTVQQYDNPTWNNGGLLLCGAGHGACTLGFDVIFCCFLDLFGIFIVFYRVFSEFGFFGPYCDQHRPTAHRWYRMGHV